MCYLFQNVSLYALYTIQRICARVIDASEFELYNVPDHLKTQKMCNKAVEKDAWQLYNVSC